jgi:hypothetical protein
VADAFTVRLPDHDHVITISAVPPARRTLGGESGWALDASDAAEFAVRRWCARNAEWPAETRVEVTAPDGTVTHHAVDCVAEPAFYVRDVEAPHAE